MGIEKVFDKQLSEEDGYVKYEAAKTELSFRIQKSQL